jgi:ankyrin repeat protein
MGGHTGCVHALLSVPGYEVDATAAEKDEEDADREGGWTALMHASDSESCTRALIAAGADVNAMGDWGNTPLYRAAKSGNTGCVRALLAADANPHIGRGPGFETALTVACRTHGDMCCIRALLDAGADANATDTRQRTPLHYAKDGACAQALIDAGARIRLRDVHGATPLEVALSRGAVESARVIQSNLAKCFLT